MSKIISIILIVTLVLSSGVYYTKYEYETQTYLYNQQVAQNHSLTNRIKTLNTEVGGLSDLVKSYDVKFSDVQISLQSVKSMITVLQKDNSDKDTKINQLLNEKTALEADAKVLRNTVVKLTGDINILNQKLHIVDEHTNSVQLDVIAGKILSLTQHTNRVQFNVILEKILSLTQERDILYGKLKEYEITITRLKQENDRLALVKRQDLEKLGYKFPNNIGEASKSHYLITVSSYDGSVVEVKSEEPKKENIVGTTKSQKKTGFWKRVFGQ
jgi:chromosome segregation ATPase